MSVARLQALPEREVARRSDRQVDVPALAGQHFPTSPAQRQQAADAKAGAGTDDQPGAIRLGTAGADLHQLVRT